VLPAWVRETAAHVRFQPRWEGHGEGNQGHAAGAAARATQGQTPSLRSGSLATPSLRSALLHPLAPTVRVHAKSDLARLLRMAASARS
jgi:hypothetical protein